ncbi:MAG: ABC transporter substrate-binding protein [Janthinobacterium lividum]
MYLPLIVMRHQKLLEQHVSRARLGTLDVVWHVIDGGDIVDDAMLAGSVDIAGVGVPGFLMLWSKTSGIPQGEMVGLAALSSGSLWLNTTNPAIGSLRDFAPDDLIAVPGNRASYAAVVLQMAVSQVFGIEHHAQLNPLMVRMSNPDAMAAMLAGRSRIKAHLASPPFSYQEAISGAVHSVFSTQALFGPMTTDVVFSPKRFVDANPGVIAAFLAAQRDANCFIRERRREAAGIYLRFGKTIMTLDEVERVLADPETQFDQTPTGIMTYVDFMASAGLIKTWPAGWTDLFVPAPQGRGGD